MQTRRIGPFSVSAIGLGYRPAQLALACLLAQGDDVIPIPGTTRADHLAEGLGAAGVTLDASTLAALGGLINPRTVTGARYNGQSQSEVDTEPFSC